MDAKLHNIQIDNHYHLNAMMSVGNETEIECIGTYNNKTGNVLIHPKIDEQETIKLFSGKLTGNTLEGHIKNIWLDITEKADDILVRVAKNDCILTHKFKFEVPEEAIIDLDKTDLKGMVNDFMEEANPDEPDLCDNKEYDLGYKCTTDEDGKPIKTGDNTLNPKVGKTDEGDLPKKTDEGDIDQGELPNKNTLNK